MPITPAQCRAARAWLDWSQADLATRARIGLSTLRDFESGRRTPVTNNLDAIARVLAEAGVTPTTDPTGRPSGITASPPATPSQEQPT